MSPNPLAHGREAGPRHHWSVYVLLALLGGMLTFAGARAQQKASDAATFRKLLEDYVLRGVPGTRRMPGSFMPKTMG